MTNFTDRASDERGTRTLILLWITAGIALVVIALRISRGVKERYIYVEDVTILASAHKISDLKYKIAAIVYCAKITNIINAGYGRHKILLGQEEYGNANSEMMYSLVWGNISTAVCKISAAILLHRAVEITTFRDEE
ncbi:hypothetical protein N7536_005801 [Penicillium majusculum]|nr:hypothetical protein N7536_005801 [Penicillium majusculum]